MASALTITECDGVESRPLIAALAAAVYPPEVLATVPWRTVQSARSQHRIVVLDSDAQVVAAAGLLVRDGLLDGRSVQIGGVGGVMTLPARQGTGIGRRAMEAVADMMARIPTMQFGMLFCEAKNIGFYRTLGWRVFDGIVSAEQNGGAHVYDVMHAMVCPVHAPAPPGGRLNVCGLPW